MSAIDLTPQSSLEAQAPDLLAEPRFFAVSEAKLLCMSICTVGLYEVYWFYRNWKLVRRREKSDIVPAMRSLFGLFFCYSLLKRVSDESVATGGSAMPAGLLASGWIVLSLLWSLPDPFWLVTYGAVFFLLPAQATINAINARAAPDHDRNDRFSGWNIFGMILGGLILVLAVIGIFLLPEPA
jgi:hypothetical protein